MTDIRIRKLAQVLVHYSLGVKAGERVVINAQPAALPLIAECYRECLRAGAFVRPRLWSNELTEIFFREASDEQLSHISDFDRLDVEHDQADLTIIADENTRYLSGIDPQRIARRSAARQPLSRRQDEREVSGEYRWCLTLYPTEAYAQDAGMSLRDYEEFVYGAGMLDLDDPVAGWRAQHDMQQRIVDYLNTRDTIHIRAPETDIRYRVGGRTWINADGRVNFPDGEVFSAPIEDSVEGVVRFSYPALHAGNEVEDVRLVFRAGEVVEATASRGQAFLEAMLASDAGAKRLGEVAFGTNYAIQRFTRELLFDEKIGGTMHLALGQSYGTTGGRNESGLHWDMVCDLKAGEVYADGELCYKDGKFILS